MAKVTKTAAYKVAEKMADNAINPKIEQLNGIVSIMLTKYAKESVPREVMSLYENPKFSMYFENKTRTKFTCDGLNENWESYELIESVPRIQNGGAYVHVSKNDYEFLIGKTKEISTLEKSKRALISKIEKTLFSLGTLNRVRDEFPDAYIYLNEIIGEKQNTTICLPISDLVNELKSYSL